VKPPAEVEIDAPLVRRLLAQQRPDLAEEPLSPLAVGWDNALFRVGGDLIARLPRRTHGAKNLSVELRWLPELADGLPLPVPAHRWAGAPGEGYPFDWALLPWIDGVPVGVTDGLDLTALATALGGFFRALHRLPVPDDAPPSDCRGVPLSSRTPDVLSWLATIRDEVDAPRIRARWLADAAAPQWSAPPVWCHGDPHPLNLLADAGRLSAVIDWGNLHGGEPAPDLAAAWMMLPPSLHDTFRDAYGPIDDETWARGRGWGTFYGVVLLEAGRSGAGDAFIRAGQRTLANLLASDDE
jgi:aminoglycoside phosphotransferase (APT) family kinase protein